MFEMLPLLGLQLLLTKRLVKSLMFDAKAYYVFESLYFAATVEVTTRPTMYRAPCNAAPFLLALVTLTVPML
jgi:hypothetical protein